MNIEIRKYDSPKGIITIYKLTNNKGASVELSSLGAGINTIVVPDRNGNLNDIVLGYKNPVDYIYDGPCAGKTAGRYANRIANGHLHIEGITYQLNINCGPNSLHGGPEGFQNQNWQSRVDNNNVIFTYMSADGEEFFPGNILTTVTYRWNDDNELLIEYHARTDRDTVINLTNHTYFNLKGDGNGNILDHILKLNCNYYLPTDTSLVPTGEYMPVAGTPMDFIEEKYIGKDIENDFLPLRIAKGYDHCWLVDGYDDKKLKKVAILKEETTGREVHISSTQAGVQVYTGNWLADSPEGKSGNKYFDYCAVAIECQGLPDAPNKPQFPSQALRAGETYSQTILYSFKSQRNK